MTDLKNQGIAFLIIVVVVDAALIFMSREVDVPIPIFVLSFFLSLILMFGILLYLYRFKISYYSSYVIQVDTNFLSKMIAIDEDKIQKGLIKAAWNHNKRISNQHDIKISWSDVKEVKTKNKGLLVCTSSLYNRIFIPFDLEDFQELENYIEQKVRQI